MEPAGPRFSVVVPLHDGGPYVEGCLRSILGQELAGSDLELVVVDDASTDDSAARAQAVCDADPRARLLRHAQNGGTLRARRDGVLATRGEYVLLVDQDDELAPGALAHVDEALRAHPVDILHFGVHVVAETPAAEGAAAGMRGFLTPPPRELQGPQILALQFAETDGFDWHVHHRALRGALARAAWAELEDVVLVLSDDLYASFALCARATSYLALADAPWYEYHLGRGDTFGAPATLDGFCALMRRDWRGYELVRAYAARAAAGEVLGVAPRDDWDARVADARDRLVEHVMNEYHDSLSDEAHGAALDAVLALWPADAVAGELWRFVRDRAYALWDTGARPADDDALWGLIADAERADALVGSGGGASARYHAMRDAAQRHLCDLGLREGDPRPEAPMPRLRRLVRRLLRKA